MRRIYGLMIVLLVSCTPILNSVNLLESVQLSLERCLYLIVVKDAPSSVDGCLQDVASTVVNGGVEYIQLSEMIYQYTSSLPTSVTAILWNYLENLYSTDKGILVADRELITRLDKSVNGVSAKSKDKVAEFLLDKLSASLIKKPDT